MRELKDLKKRLEEGAELCLAGLGDSLTYGWEVSRGFFDRFVDELERRYPKASLRRINAGVPGDVAPGGMGRLAALLAQKPDVVFVQFALNDCFGGAPLEGFVRAQEDLATTIRGAGALPVLCTSCPVAWPSHAQQVATFYAAILAVAKGLDVPGVAIHESWENSAEAREGRKLWTEDGVHPTDLGHSLMARALLRALEGDETP